MSLAKRATTTQGAQAVLAWAAVAYIRLVHATTRWTVVCPPRVEALEAAERPYLVCFWHGRLLMMGSAWRRPPERFHMLISEHRDGILIARAIARLGFSTIGGSSKRGGTSALRAMQRLLRAGECVGITPDGPRGRRMRAKLGAVKAAQLADVPLLPVAYATARRRIFNSWDRFCLALPFSRGVILWGEPVLVARDAGEAALQGARLLLEERLNAITAEADRLCGQAPVEPDVVAESAGHARA